MQVEILIHTSSHHTAPILFHKIVEVEKLEDLADVKIEIDNEVYKTTYGRDYNLEHDSLQFIYENSHLPDFLANEEKDVSFEECFNDMIDIEDEEEEDKQTYYHAQIRLLK